MKPGNSGGAKALWSADRRVKGARTAKIDGNIYEPRPAKSGTVRKLQRTLMAKPRQNPIGGSIAFGTKCGGRTFCAKLLDTAAARRVLQEWMGWDSVISRPKAWTNGWGN